MKTETLMWAIVDKSSLTHKDADGRFTLLSSRGDARALKRWKETVRRVKVTVEDAG